MNELPEKEVNLSLQEELLTMMDSDQAVRSDASQDIASVDIQNQQKLAEIISEHGWPSASLVGKDAAHAAWLIVQHADNDSEFQRSCFDKMNSLPESEISQEDLAYLADRIRVNEGRPQLFGTQWREDPDLGYIPEEIEDRDGLDERRAEVGLDPFEEFSAKMLEFYTNWKEKNE